MSGTVITAALALCAPGAPLLAQGRGGEPVPFGPSPSEGEGDVDFNNVVLTWNNPASACDVGNGSFEEGSFSGWATITGPGNELSQWNVSPSGGGLGFFGPGFPAGGEFFAQNGFDGDAGLFYELRRTVTVASDAASAALEWQERIRWDLLNFGEPTQPRPYVVRVEPAGGGAALATLFTRSLTPGSVGDTGYVYHVVDLIGAGVAPGAMVDLVWREQVPESFVGPAQIEIDAVRFTCSTDGALRGVHEHFTLDDWASPARAWASDASFASRREAYARARAGTDDGGSDAATLRGGAPVLYDVLLDTVSPPIAALCVGAALPSCGPLAPLAPDTIYHWRVIRHGPGGDTIGPVWSFTTDEDCNANDQSDNIDILTGASEDCNANFIPEECECCVADINCDGHRNTADLGLLIGAFFTGDCRADINDDGVVDTADLGVLFFWFGAGCP